MATQPRRPLIRSVRPQNSPLRSLRSTGTKRARSPAPDDTHDGPSLATKRVRAADTSQHKHKSRADKLQQELEFRQKYTRSMPSWIFHFDPSINSVVMNKLGERINRLGGVSMHIVMSRNALMFVLFSDHRRFLFERNHSFNCQRH